LGVVSTRKPLSRLPPRKWLAEVKFAEPTKNSSRAGFREKNRYTLACTKRGATSLPLPPRVRSAGSFPQETPGRPRTDSKRASRHNTSPDCPRDNSTRTSFGAKRSISASKGKLTSASSKYGEMTSRFAPYNRLPAAPYRKSITGWLPLYKRVCSSSAVDR
jgi:hypothetical protein